MTSTVLANAAHRGQATRARPSSTRFLVINATDRAKAKAALDIEDYFDIFVGSGDILIYRMPRNAVSVPASKPRDCGYTLRESAADDPVVAERIAGVVDAHPWGIRDPECSFYSINHERLAMLLYALSPVMGDDDEADAWWSDDESQVLNGGDPYFKAARESVEINSREARARRAHTKPKPLATKAEVTVAVPAIVPNSAAPIQLPAPLVSVPLGDLAMAEPQPTPYVVSPIVPAGVVTLMSGDGGVGKTKLALAIGAHVAAGAWTWGQYRLRPGKVVFVSLEDEGAEVRATLRNICETYRLNSADVARDMVVLDGSACDGAMAVEVSTAGRKSLQFTSLGAEVFQACAGASLVIVDNASEAFAANENDRPLVRAFVKRLAQTARANNAGMILLAHVDKAGVRHGTNGATYSGSTAWNNSARSRLALIQVDDDTIELRHEKSNRGPKAKPIPLRREGNGVLVLADRAPESVSNFDQELLDCVARASATGEPVGAHRNGPGNAHARLTTAPGFPPALKSKAKFWAAHDRLVHAKRLIRVDYTGAGRKTKTKLEVAPVAPVAQVPEN